MKTQHILSARQFDRTRLERLFASADQMQELYRKRIRPERKNHDCIALLFFEASTRTESSFQMAAYCLDIPIGYPAKDPNSFSSAAKGETLEHTIRMFCNYPYLKAIVIRHPDDYSAEIAAEVADPFGISVINAGDGSNEHPTQALLDLYTIKNKVEKPLSEVKLVLANDIEFSRTIRSLALLFVTNYRPSEIGICAPKGILLPRALEDELIREGVKIGIFRNLLDAADWADFLYMTRPQLERVAKDIVDPEEKKQAIAARRALFQDFHITPDLLARIRADSKCLVGHPLPVNSKDFNEISKECDNHYRCVYFDQAAYGLPIRMATLDQLIPNVPYPTA